MVHLHRGLLLLLVVCSLASLAAEPPAPFIRYKDRVVFFGDSITYIGVYSLPISSFFTLRYPEYHVFTLRNAGVPGNTAQDGLKRLQRDVLDQAPTVVFICFGTNEMRAAPRDPKTLETYLATMAGIVQALKAEPHIRPVLLSPPCVDPDGTANGIWYKSPAECQAANAMVGQMTDGLRELAAREKITFCDIFHPLLEIQTKMKAADPHWTMIPDGIHPDELGGAVMAATILNDLFCTRPAPGIAIDAAKETAETEQCAVIDLQCAPTRVSFTRTDAVLPLTLWNAEHGEQTRVMRALHGFPGYQEWNRYPLRVTGLPGGRWRLAAPGFPDLGTYPAAEWAAGVDLSPVLGPWSDVGMLMNWLAGAQQERSSGLADSMRKIDQWPLSDAQRGEAKELQRQLLDLALQQSTNSRYLLMDNAHRTSTWVLTRVGE